MCHKKAKTLAVAETPNAKKSLRAQEKRPKRGGLRQGRYGGGDRSREQTNKQTGDRGSAERYKSTKTINQGYTLQYSYMYSVSDICAYG